GDKAAAIVVALDGAPQRGVGLDLRTDHISRRDVLRTGQSGESLCLCALTGPLRAKEYNSHRLASPTFQTYSGEPCDDLHHRRTAESPVTTSTIDELRRLLRLLS